MNLALWIMYMPGFTRKKNVWNKKDSISGCNFDSFCANHESDNVIGESGSTGGVLLKGSNPLQTSLFFTKGNHISPISSAKQSKSVPLSRNAHLQCWGCYATCSILSWCLGSEAIFEMMQHFQ